MKQPVQGHSGGLFSLLKPYWYLLAGATLLGIVAGASITVLLATTNRALHAQTFGIGMVLAFGGICLVALVSSIVSDVGTNYVGQKVIASLRKSLGGKVLCAPIDQLERYRTHRLIPVLTHDIDTISDFSFALAPLAISLTVTLGCLAYLASLSWVVFALMLVAIALGSIAQYLARLKGIRGFYSARDQEDLLQKHYHAIAEGAKELRMHSGRRHTMLTDGIRGTADRICDIQVKSVNTFIVAKSFGSMLFFAVIGLTLASQLYWPQADTSVISGFVLILLYMKGPMEHLIGTLPIISRAQIAFRRIKELSETFSTAEPYLLEEPSNQQATFETLELDQVRYGFAKVGESPAFELGPVNLSIHRGETLFIVGENGGGKTTLIKLLLGLYNPQHGELRLNGVPVVAQTRDAYRQLFTTVFADYYLFDDILRTSPKALESVESYLTKMELGHKVSIEDGAFSTTDLSTGQRKRLALISAWLEGRPILVFDEWAADQDPTFRRIFYTELLPELKRMGKTIIVISHDDRYFEAADRVIQLKAGSIHSAREHETLTPA
ncbi:cyclic peptide export ABC transporter [Pseudomonas silvicola]|nr:cyclic peptide export ABC transporter [Pseudomonas silvicola]